MTTPTTSAQAPARTATGRSGVWWLVAVGLVLLSFIPVLGGALRLTELSVGADLTPQNARFFASPLPVVIHIVAATVFCVVGAFQFVPTLRRFAWHRRSGRVMFVAGVLAAVSGLVMTVTYPWPAGDGVALYVLRLVFGSLMAVSLVLGFAAIRRRDVERHRRWMARGYAIGIAAGTQAVVLTAWLLAVGPATESERAALMGASWAFNLLLVEVVRFAGVRSRRG